jgi:hypothetical protein
MRSTAPLSFFVRGSERFYLSHSTRGEGGEDHEQRGVAWHLQAEVDDFLEGDGNEPCDRSHSDPVVRVV